MRVSSCQSNCRVPSHNPFGASARNGEYHTLHSIRRLTSGESAGSPLGPNRSSKSVPALVRPRNGTSSADHEGELTGEDRRRTSESFLWENEPMSAAAVLGGHHTDLLGRSFSTTGPSSNTSFNANGGLDAASCVWENEPMSAAAMSFKVVPRLSLGRVAEVPEVLLNAAEREALDVSAVSSAAPDPTVADAPRLAPVQTRFPVASTQSGVPAWRPHRPAPAPPVQRANSFPNHKQNEDYLEYEVTSSLTLKETPRSQRRHELQREIWEGQAAAAAAGNTVMTSAIAHHHRTPDSPHVTFAPAPSASADPAPLLSSSNAQVAATLPVDTADPSKASYTKEAVLESAVSTALPLEPAAMQRSDEAPLTAVEAPTVAATQSPGPDLVWEEGHNSTEDTPLMPRPASVMTLYESAHSGALSEATEDIPQQDAV